MSIFASWWGYLAVGVAVAFAIIQARAFIYDSLISAMTAAWYKAVLERLPSNVRILDVGIGTGAALLANKDIIVAKKLTVVGVDYDAQYIERCNQLIASHSFASHLSAVCKSIYDYAPPAGTSFDVAYFSGSLMIMPDPKAALVHVSKLLGPKGVIYTTQTFEAKPNRVLEVMKPLLKFLTTIDFGNVTYEKDFLATVAAAGLEVAEAASIAAASSLSGAASKSGRTFKLYKLVPQNASRASSSSTSTSAADGKKFK